MFQLLIVVYKWMNVIKNTLMVEIHLIQFHYYFQFYMLIVEIINLIVQLK